MTSAAGFIRTTLIGEGRAVSVNLDVPPTSGTPDTSLDDEDGKEREVFVNMNSRRLVGVLSALATASLVSSTFGGMVDVAGAIPAEHVSTQWAAGPTLAKGAGHLQCVNIWATASVSEEPFDEQLASSPNFGNSGCILDLTRRASFTLPGIAADSSAATMDSPRRPGDPSSSSGGIEEDDARALALPDAVHMFPLGALLAALAIRRMQRSARRA